MKRNQYVRSLLIAILAVSVVVLPACDHSNVGAGGVITQSQNCKFSDNLGETADSFISRCRKAGIRREFPGRYYSKTLREIQKDKSKDGKKARKLLNDGRFKK